MQEIPAEVRSWLGDRTPLDALNGRRFQISTVAAALDLPPHTVGNYVKQSRVPLCSSPPPQQRMPRMFCLVDVYQIGLVQRFSVFESQHIQNTAKSIYTGLLIASRVRSRHSRKDVEKKLQREFCEDIYSTHPLFHHRDLSKPYHLFRAVNIDGGISAVFITDEGFASIGTHVHDAVIVNATVRLAEIDLALVKLLASAEAEREPASAD